MSFVNRVDTQNGTLMYNIMNKEVSSQLKIAKLMFKLSESEMSLLEVMLEYTYTAGSIASFEKSIEIITGVVCPRCKQLKKDINDINFIKEAGMCLLCDHCLYE